MQQINMFLTMLAHFLSPSERALSSSCSNDRPMYVPDLFLQGYVISAEARKEAQAQSPPPPQPQPQTQPQTPSQQPVNGGAGATPSNQSGQSLAAQRKSTAREAEVVAAQPQRPMQSSLLLSDDVVIQSRLPTTIVDLYERSVLQTRPLHEFQQLRSDFLECQLAALNPGVHQSQHQPPAAPGAAASAKPQKDTASGGSSVPGGTLARADEPPAAPATLASGLVSVVTTAAGAVAGAASALSSPPAAVTSAAVPPVNGAAPAAPVAQPTVAANTGGQMNGSNRWTVQEGLFQSVTDPAPCVVRLCSELAVLPAQMREAYIAQTTRLWMRMAVAIIAFVDAESVLGAENVPTVLPTTLKRMKSELGILSDQDLAVYLGIAEKLQPGIYTALHGDPITIEEKFLELFESF
eukprot:TRINITY_DN1696_c0_g1_i2.p1 TRINITY_DN1696_c0_g1~~TRINITY_DN1696_c0_g1_i2.p1  ORF type:complete len:408 (+),score=107.64 TRINITY_DN1696_c0_g1_i2:180-1403(+)